MVDNSKFIERIINEGKVLGTNKKLGVYARRFMLNQMAYVIVNGEIVHQSIYDANVVREYKNQVAKVKSN
jgi:hypothetical protein